MTDGPTAIDPLVAEGPRAPVESLRPGLSLQRVLLFDPDGPMMADLATGDIRRYESGPPVSVPMVSDRFDLGSVGRLQLQLTRDPRPTSTAQTLVGLDVRSANSAVDVRILPTNLLEIVGSGRASDVSITASAGMSPAYVIVIEHDGDKVTVAVRNAETLDFTSVVVDVSDATDSVLSIGGPSDRSGGAPGRRRSVPVLIDVQKAPTPVDQLARVARGARRLAGVVRNRVS